MCEFTAWIVRMWLTKIFDRNVNKEIPHIQKEVKKQNWIE